MISQSQKLALSHLPTNISQFQKSHVNIGIQAMLDSAHDVCKVVLDSFKDLDHGLIVDMQCMNPGCSHFRNLYTHSPFCCSLCEENLNNPEISGHTMQGRLQCTKYIDTFRDLKTYVTSMEGTYFNEAMDFLEDHPNV